MKLLLGFVIGLVLGLIAHWTSPYASWVQMVTAYLTGPVSQIFLRLLFMLAMPLLFSALVLGIAEMGDIRSLKRIGVRTLIFTVWISSIAAVNRPAPR